MGYDIKLRKYTFNFDQVDFPIMLSDKVKDYLFLEYGGSNEMSRKQFEEILCGENRDQNACRILGILIEEKKSERLPPSEFDILEDDIIEPVSVEKTTYFTRTVQTHRGVCKFAEHIFDFEYCVEITKSNNMDSTKVSLKDCYVIQKGHTFKNSNRFLHLACKYYSYHENKKLEKEEIARITKEEEETWIQFRLEHQQELKDWLIPLVENPVRFHPCQMYANSVLRGYPYYSFVKALDSGECDLCTRNCRFKETLLENGQHSKEWYEIGLDKLDLKYL